MLKNLVTILAVIGFVSTSMAAGPGKTRVETTREKVTKPKTAVEENQQKARDNLTGSKVAEQTREASKAGLTPTEINNVLAKIENEGVRKNIREAISKRSDKVTDDASFLAEVVTNLMMEVNSNPNPKEQQQLLQFIESSFVMMKIGGNGGKSARQAMLTLSTELSRPGSNLDAAIRTAIQKAFGYSGQRLEDKIKEFKKECMGA